MSFNPTESTSTIQLTPTVLPEDSHDFCQVQTSTSESPTKSPYEVDQVPQSAMLAAGDISTILSFALLAAVLLRK